jgi:hypothetical protein
LSVAATASGRMGGAIGDDVLWRQARSQFSRAEISENY